MKLNFLRTFALPLALLFSALSFDACKEKCKDCPDGADCIDATCVCQTGRLMFNNSCFQLGNNSFFGVNSACYCYDTLAISISGTGETRSLTMPIKYDNQVGSLSQTVFYYELSDGDSLYFPQLDLRCFAPDDTPLKPAVYGKKQPNGSWKLLLEFRDAISLAVYDSCTIVLNKFE